MPWYSDFTGNIFSPNFRWDYTPSPSPGRFLRDATNSTQDAQLLNWASPGYLFKSSKTYIWKTYVTNFNDSAQVSGIPTKKLSINTPYKSGTFSYVASTYQQFQVFPNPPVTTLIPRLTTLPTSTDTNNCLVFIDRPVSDSLNVERSKYSATTTGFQNSGLIESKLLEIDWLMQGYSFATSSNGSLDRQYEGWRYLENDESFEFVHQNKTLTYKLPLSLAIGQTGNLNSVAVGKRSFSGLLTAATGSNFISRYIQTPIFNMSFEFTTPFSATISVYLFDNQPPITTNPVAFNNFLNTGQKIAKVSGTGTCSFFNLSGNKHLTFVCEYLNNSVQYTGRISNIKIVEGYSPTDNNEEFLLTNTNQYFEPTTLNPIGTSNFSQFNVIASTPNTRHENSGIIFGPTGSTGSYPGFFSDLYGTVVNLSSQISKIGNAKFKAGIWENGVWNNGLRIDQNSYEFTDVELAIKMTTRNITWRIQIVGPTSSVSNFEVGDKVSISNIVAIDINEERKLLKNYYTIINKSDTILVVETENNFPIRRIEKDSETHKILMTKNVWLNGGFLNGYFEGIWNDGLFRGYPFITEMYNSHWIDGNFNGGHFFSERRSFVFADTYYVDGYVGLTFGATAHGFVQGDKIIIDKTDKTINPNYDGIHTVTNIINDYLIVTDKIWENSSTLESGIAYKQATTGLVQNFNFFDNNVAPKTSQTSVNPQEIWRFNSWMDLVYKTQSSTNIGSNKSLFNAQSNNINEVLEKHKFGFGNYTAMNLYGYITEDVLSSKSQFRDIDTFFKRNYSLGTKYQIYQDFLGDISEFNNSFDSNPELGNLSNFYTDGWTYSFSGILATYSYLNRYIKKRSSVQDFISYDSNGPSQNLNPTFSANGGGPIWGPVSFNSLVENSFGLLISEDIANQSFGVSISGIYQVNVSIPANFYTIAYAPGLIGGGLDNDKLILSENVILGELRLVKVDELTNSTLLLAKKVIKTSGGDYNTGSETFPEGDDWAEFETNMTLNIDWKGQLNKNDKVRVLFQRCRTIIQNYNLAGPWRGSGFEQGFGLNDNITDVLARWRFGTSSTISINNEGVDQSLGFNIKRTTNKTLQYESDKEISFFTLNNTNINIEKNRYSMIEFDVIKQPDSILNIFSYGTQSFDLQFHTIDLYNFTNFMNSDSTYGLTHAYPAGYEPLITPFSDYLSVYSNGIDYKYTGQSRVTEFFYNRPGLDLGFWNFNTQYTNNEVSKVHEIDNLKFYEVDMIPFFQYTTEDHVNKQIQIPLVGVAPIIDYTDENFNFVGNIQISLDGISVDSVGNQLIFVNSITTNIDYTSSGAQSG